MGAVVVLDQKNNITGDLDVIIRFADGSAQGQVSRERQLPQSGRGHSLGWLRR